MRPADDLHQRRVERALATETFGRRVVYYDVVGSTNDVAKHLAAQDALEGTVVVADEQTAGRGRLERRWVAPPGKCLLCSLLFRPELLPSQAHRLTMLCSMAAADAIQAVAGLDVALKWPNDLIVKSGSQTWRKLAGILTESGLTGDVLDFVVVGIGINVNVPEEALPALDPHATSILAESGRQVDRAKLLAALLAGVESRYARLQAGESPRDEWAARLTTLDERVTVTATEGTFTGVAEAVDEDGALLLRTDDGEHRRLLAGDVTLADR